VRLEVTGHRGALGDDACVVLELSKAKQNHEGVHTEEGNRGGQE
jgi:hypothetical protein